jgi:hypothetical protein
MIIPIKRSYLNRFRPASMMTKEKEFTERRKHERFKIKNGAIAMIQPLSAPGTTQKYCQILLKVTYGYQMWIK